MFALPGLRALAVAVLALGSAAAVLGPPPTEPSASLTPVAAERAAAPLPKGPAGGWNLRFRDEFNGKAVNWRKWADHSSAEADHGRGNKGNQQLEWNRGANCSVAKGRLTITAKPGNVTSPSGEHYRWTSCLLSSTPGYAFQYGYIETRAKLPAPKGFWPAFWTWQAPGINRWIETDVFEYFSDNRSRLYHRQHSGEGDGCIRTNLGFDPSAGYHTYGADIKASGTTDFYVDGRRVCTARGTSTGRTNILLDVFVYAGKPPAPGTIGRMRVDYVRAWKR